MENNEEASKILFALHPKFPAEIVLEIFSHLAAEIEIPVLEGPFALSAALRSAIDFLLLDHLANDILRQCAEESLLEHGTWILNNDSFKHFTSSRHPPPAQAEIDILHQIRYVKLTLDAGMGPHTFIPALIAGTRFINLVKLAQPNLITARLRICCEVYDSYDAKKEKFNEGPSTGSTRAYMAQIVKQFTEAARAKNMSFRLSFWISNMELADNCIEGGPRMSLKGRAGKEVVDEAIDMVTVRN